jgi:hypothetical protein
LQAQEAIPASGGNASGSGGLVSYSIGQLVYTTNTGSNGSVAQGIQQPYEISVVTGIKEASSINLICSVYPNPTTDFLTLKVENFNKENLLYQLYNLNGKLLENKKVTSNKNAIALSGFGPGTYFLKVTCNNKEVKTFKIVKN